jgi:ribonuclease J
MPETQKKTEKKTKKTAGKSLRVVKKTQKSNMRKISSDAELQVIPLGGLEEIGKNMTLFVCGEDAVIVDCGMSFPDDDLLGVDAVIPDFSYLAEVKDRLRGLVLTHGHEDHIGGIPYLLKQYNVPIYGTPLTMGLVGYKLKEHGLADAAEMHVVHTGDTVELGCFRIEFIRMNHSIPDSAALAINTPAGTLIHTGDFKIDYTPVFGETADLARLGEYGKQGVLALLCDSTNAEKAGSSLTESQVGKSFEALFSRAEGKRVIIATFSTNIYRIQQIIDFAEKHGRKIAISGRSMVNTVSIARDLGYLTYKEDTFVDINAMGRFRPEQLVIITTGSQGEPMSALTRIAAGEHRFVKVDKKDCIIISANPIVGNERAVINVINSLLSLGSDVIYESMYEIHASGHACQDEIKLVLSLTQPQYFMPVHGEIKHLIKNAGNARQKGITPDRIVIGKIGDVVTFRHGKVFREGTVPSGRVLVDGLGVGDVGKVVLRDRQVLANEGMLVVVCSIDSNTGSLIVGPDIVSRGFVYVKESEELIEEAKALVSGIIARQEGSRRRNVSNMKSEIREEVADMIYRRLQRNPMVIPVIMEI